MELNQYQEQAMTTCMKSSDNFAYMFINLIGEVGEFASKVAKLIRKGEAEIYNNELDIESQNTPEEEKKYSYDYCQQLCDERDEQYEIELCKEAGDILWQLAGLCSAMGWELEAVAQINLDKLASRKERGQIDGDGDNR